MRGMSLLLLLVCLAFGAEAGERPSLQIFTWSDYFDSGIIDEFQRKHGCDVVLSVFDSNETLYAALDMDSGSFDILTPSTYMVVVLREAGFLSDIDHSLLPNLRHLTPDPVDYGVDREMIYSIPYARTVTGVGYDRERVRADALGSWGIFGSDAAPGKTAFLGDMRECLGAALKYLGYSLNTVDPAEIAEAGRVLREWGARADVFDVDGAKDGLLEGEYAYVQQYNGDVLQVMEVNPRVDFFVPREGTMVTSDVFAVSSGSPAKELAHAFINHMLDPAVARRNMETVLYYMPNRDALDMLSPEIRDSGAFTISPDILAKSEIIRTVPPEVNALYEKAWEEARRAEP